MSDEQTCPKCGEAMTWDGLQWTCIECIRRTVASHAHLGQPVTPTWGFWQPLADCDSGRRTFPIRRDSEE